MFQFLGITLGKRSREMSQSSHFQMTLRVLGYREDGAWVAHCLETDIVGNGETPDAALHDLLDLTRMQISFAHSKGLPSLVFHPAPMHIQEKYAYLVADSLRSFPSTALDPDAAVGSIQLQDALEVPGQFAWAGAN